ncbi:hypothetical protein [Roseivirga misakiensis]|uniref:Sulfate ABC transporter permease n=1 Tax=Roseivirga misakiensis TaxID=1563681 RepID=A0A1E5T522_9BACT|nr:hypothetical protein [Roseivirga misakiensis]OEK06460.1 hypothetical protein BFP71_01930 [Roseivirga misakiensis]
MPREFSSLELRVREWISFDKKLFFVALCIISFLLLYVQQSFIIGEIAAFQFLEGPEALVFKIISGFKYLAIPIVYGIKFTVVGFILWVGCFLWGYRVEYNKCWQIAMIAEVIFFVPVLLKIFWFMFVSTDPNYFEYQAFYPFSLMNFYHYADVADSKIYPNQALNLFEIGYWIVLAYGVDFAARKKKSIANSIVATSYIPLFLFWLWFYISVYG